MKKEIFFTSLLLSLIMLSTMATSASATDYTKVGVRAGNTADYNYTTPKATGTVHIQFLQINGAEVTASISTTYSNGSKAPTTNVTSDLSTALFNRLFPLLVAANLSKGDSVLPNATNYEIDETITMNALGANRTVNHLDHNIGYSYFDAYWDKATGLAIKTNETVTEQQSIFLGIPAGSYITNLIATTAFTTTYPAETAVALLITAAGIIAVTLAAAVITQHRKPKTTTN
jgi:hypothetical protein